MTCTRSTSSRSARDGGSSRPARGRVVLEEDGGDVASGRPPQPARRQLEPPRALQDHDVDVGRRRAPRATPRRRSRASPTPRAARRPRARARAASAAGTGGGPGRTPSSTSRARARSGCSRGHLRVAPASAATASTTVWGVTDARQGWPGTGHSRARVPRQAGLLVAEQHVRHAVGRPAHGGHDRREQRDDRRADRGGQVRRAGVADDHRGGPRHTPASCGEVGAAAEVGARAAGDRGGEARARRAPPVTTTRHPSAASSAAARAACSAGQLRAGAAAPGCTTTYGRPARGRRPRAARRTASRPSSPGRVARGSRDGQPARARAGPRAGPPRGAGGRRARTRGSRPRPP